MKNYKYLQLLYILSLVSIIFCGILIADINISASVDKNVVSLNDNVTLQVVVSGDTTNIPQPKIPQISGFQIYSSGRSQSISIVNGKVSSSVTFTYILSPTRIGDFEIPPIVLEYQGKTYQTEPIKIKVEKSVSTTPQQTPYHRDVYRGSQRGIFVETFVDKKRAYVGEQITLTFRFYTKVNLVSQPQYTPPDTSGFLTEDLPPQKNYYTTIAGERYFVSEIKTALFPTTAGKFTIGPAMVRCVIEDFDINDFFSDDFFKRFFSTGKEVVLKSEPIEITVLPLPQPQPADFSGSVGEYTITTTIDKQKIAQNETTFLNVKITGIGNIKSVTLPKPIIERNLGNNFVVYDPITSFDVKKENYVVKGSKTFKIPIACTTLGNITIPEFRYTFFNPKTQRYETISSKPILIEVTPSQQVSLNQKIQTQLPQQKKIELEDIRYIMTTLKCKKSTRPNNSLLYLQLLPFLSWLIFVSYRTYKAKQYSNIKKYRATKALSIAKKQLKRLTPDKDFIEQIYDIFLTYFADKIGVAKEEINTEQIKSFLNNRVKKDIFDQTISLWEELNFYRFSPVKDRNLDLETLKKRVEKILQNIEYEI